MTEGASYAVTVADHPAIQACVVDDGAGTIAGGDVTDVVVRCDAKVFFRADDGTGCEPYLTDGTAAGTLRLADIHPTGSSGCADDLDSDGVPHRLGDKLVFAATDPTHGLELWITDGTTQGTSLIADVSPGPAAGALTWMAVFDGAVYGRGPGGELWSTDGTAAGTGLVADVNPNGQAAVSSLTTFGSELYFAATSAGVRQVWKTDGTAAGTVVALSAPQPSNIISIPMAVDGTTLYYSSGTFSDRELFASDGTDPGSVSLDLDPAGATNPSQLLAVGGTLFYRGIAAGLGVELYVTDGTLAGTSVIDVAPGPTTSFPNPLGTFGGQLVFTSTEGLWLLVANQPTPLYSSSTVSDDLLITSSRIYFQGEDASGGNELWTSDGTMAGTSRLADIEPGPESSFPFQLAKLPNDDTAFFIASTAAAGAEPWRSDGTEAGTQLILDINPGPAGSTGDD